MVGRSVAVGLVLIVGLSGCLSGLGPAIQPTGVPQQVQDVIDYALARLEQDHDHVKELADHAGAIGVVPASFIPARPGGYPKGETYFELAVKGSYAYMSFGPDPTSGYVQPNVEAGVVIYDVSDQAHPKEVGRVLTQFLGDVEVSDDGNWLYASTQRSGYPYPFTTSTNYGPAGDLPRGTYVVDVKDKTRPQIVGFEPLPPNGPHTITYYMMPDGRELLFQSTYDVLFTVYPQNLGQALATQKVVISQIVSAGPTQTLRPLGVFQLLVPDEGTPGDPKQKLHFPHDATAHVDPASKRVIMDVAYWDSGMVEVDITDPSMPKELSRFADTGPSRYTKTHLVRVFPGTIGGRLVAVLEPEIPTGEDSGQYTFVDVTNPAQPKKLGSWALPGGHIVDKPFIFSPHNFDLVCGGDGQVTGRPIDYAEPCVEPRVVLTHFHGGLWVLDAANPAQPQATGFYFPRIARDNIEPGPDFFPLPGLDQVIVKDGYGFAPEMWTGLHILKLGTPGVVALDA